MAHRLVNIVKKSIGLITIVVLLSVTVSQAQENAPAKVNENAIQSLLSGINSENYGLKRSSIYLAGKYKLTETINDLSVQLAGDNEPTTRILIALSLYQIGSDDCLSAIKDAAVNDDDLKVRKICAEIYNAFVQNNYTVTAEKY